MIDSGPDKDLGSRNESRFLSCLRPDTIKTKAILTPGEGGGHAVSTRYHAQLVRGGPWRKIIGNS